MLKIAGKVRFAGNRITISTTISPELWELAKRLNIGWNDALARGVRVLSKIETELEDGVKDVKKVESKEEVAKLRRTIGVLQGHILKMSDEMEEKKSEN